MRVLMVMIFWAFPALALADPVVVKAGDHGSFTRLILEFDDRPTWSFRNQGNGYRVRFDQVSPLSFDLSRVFRLIDRERVRDIRAIGNNAIEIDLACRCALEVSTSGDRALVVDIHQPSEEAPEVQANVTAMPTPVNPGDGSAVPGPSDTILPNRTPAVFPGISDTLLPGPAPIIERPANPAPAFRPATQGSSFAVEAMALALSRAAAQGLVSASPDIGAHAATGPSPRAGDDDVRSNLAVSTGFDLAIPSMTATLSPTDAGRVCIANDAIDVAAWGDASDVTMHGRLRGEAIAEDGSIDADGAKRLARFYLNLGFGAEARVTARFLPASRDREIIEALADVMDHGTSTAPILSGQTGCEGLVSLWATLAAPLNQETQPANTDHLLSAFSALPSHLRNQLGPLLSDRLQSAGLHEDAHMAMNAVTRAGITSDESELANARLGLEGTHADAARDVLSDLSNGTDETAAAALLELLEDAEARGMAPNPVWVEDAPTLVDALEGTEIAEKLNLAGLRGLIVLGRFDDFRAAVVEDSPGVTPATRQALAVEAMRAAEHSGSDPDFVKAEVGLSKIVDIEKINREVRYALAKRLTETGLASRAMAYLPETAESLEDLTVTAKVLVASGRMNDAVDLLRDWGLQGTDDLLATALVAAGNDSEAIAHFVQAGDLEAAVGSALRTGDWEWVAANGPDEISDAANGLISSPLEDLQDTDAPNSALIEASRTRRENMRALLDLTSPDGSAAAFTN
jgi:hypothetical protein